MGRGIRDMDTYRDDPSLDDAVSLHTTPGDDFNDASESSGLLPEDDYPGSAGPPPAYTDLEAPPPLSSQDGTGQDRPAIEVTNTGLHFMGKNVNNPRQETLMMCDPKCDTDPVHLENIVKKVSRVSPSPMITIQGTHTETTRRGDKKETRAVTDFNIEVNIRLCLHPSEFTFDTSQMTMRTIENSEKAHRGGFWKTRAPGFKRDLEVGPAKPKLTEWCHRYCASHSKLKVFCITHRITGLDEKYLRGRLVSLIRSTHYLGNITIMFPVHGRKIDIYSTNKINQWRITTWIRWVFYLTFFWIFAWPYLYFATKRYSPVVVEWPFSKTNANGGKVYTTYSEEQWVQMFGPAIQTLATERYQGCANHETLRGILSRSNRSNIPIQTGHEGVDTAANFLRAGLRAANDIFNSGGWGGDC